MPFKKGQSGNPGGRPKVQSEVRELARSYGRKAILKLASIMENVEAPIREQREAAEALLDRGYGRVVSATDMSLLINNAGRNDDGGEVVIEVKFGKDRQLEDEAAMREINPRPLLEDRRDVRTPRIDNRSDDWPGKYR
jgi:hypothetical protein